VFFPPCRLLREYSDTAVSAYPLTRNSASYADIGIDATASPRICCRPGTTSARSRNFSAIQMSPQAWSTRTSSSSAVARCAARSIRS